MNTIAGRHPMKRNRKFLLQSNPSRTTTNASVLIRRSSPDWMMIKRNVWCSRLVAFLLCSLTSTIFLQHVQSFSSSQTPWDSQQRQRYKLHHTKKTNTGDNLVLRASSSSSSSSSSYSSIPQQTDFTHALAIVPKLQDWDRLQRARHYARDPIFHEWPPAIRLFHPFVTSTDVAFDIAQIIEDLEIEPFDIKLDTWVIVPHIEALQYEWFNQQASPTVSSNIDTDIVLHNEDDTDREVRELIQSEERIGIQKAQQRYPERKSVKRTESSNSKKTAENLLKEQRKAMDEDFGSCILCLEPDEESKHKLIDLRDALRETLFFESYFSPSSVYSWEYVKEINMGYRPLIPITKFESFQSAMDVARRLKGLWGEPLCIRVTDLHLISCKDDKDEKTVEWSVPTRAVGGPSQSALEWKDKAWGCNAKIMLIGEEMEQDQEANEEMVQKIMELGEPGGMDISEDYTVLNDEEETTAGILKWLDDEEDHDEGTEVVIGRTHFFTGEQRIYPGMPATSVVDAKDRSLGDAGAVSGAARRRGTINRQANLLTDGEYGQRSTDYSPWGMFERQAKEKFTDLPEVETKEDL